MHDFSTSTRTELNGFARREPTIPSLFRGRLHG